MDCEQPKHGQDGITNAVDSETLAMQKNILLDKIKGGWAGQVIGCTYGGPTEFKYCGTMIPDYTPIPWDASRMKWYFENEPGLYDDVYMDLTFVEVFETEGLDAPATAHARAFAEAGYQLWHANQAARYNILNGIQPPASGYWENNPHADDIDFQIEADFAGLMSPGMANTAAEICDQVGHIMNCGDGWYGGVYVAAMYSLAFIYADIETIVSQGLKCIPEQSDFHKCISDIINWYHQYPDDWRRNWFECEKKWSADIGCPDGVFNAFNIDAKINAAYITIGLLYGGGDYRKTIDISTRCGQDSDCNPASAAGILGTMLGYAKIPDYWKQGLISIEDIDFKYTRISLNDVYTLSYKHAIKNIEKHGGRINNKEVSIKLHSPLPVKYEKGFLNHYPSKIIDIKENQKQLNAGHKEFSFDFEGIGFIVKGKSIVNQDTGKDYNPKIDVIIDGIPAESISLPTNFTKRRNEICWKYNLKAQKHTVTLRLRNPEKTCTILLDSILVYSDSSQ
jgi:hypothetical protein